MRDLERCGAIEVVQEQKVRGLKEKLYKSLPMAYVISPTPSEARVKMQDRYSWASLVNTLARALWDLMHLRKAADATEKQLATLAIDVEVYFDSPSKRKEFSEELVDFVEVLARR
jgi:hypothetical protein